MKNKVIMPEFEINCTPLEKIVFDSYSIEISLDDIDEKRRIITFKPYQALKIITIDCTSAIDYYNEYCYRGGVFHSHLLEIIDSAWIKELKIALSDRTATFLNKSKHYVLPLQDNVIELVAWNFAID